MRLAATLALALGLLAALAGGSADARSEPTSDFAAVLEPSLVIPAPHGVTPRACGRLSGHLRRGCISGCSAAYRLSFTHLTGVPTDIVIRFGSPGESGHVWHRLCSRYEGRGDCPRARHGILRGTFVAPAGVRDIGRHDFYVEISTAANPLGELRGQVELR
jgi:hypothetical protein